MLGSPILRSFDNRLDDIVAPCLIHSGFGSAFIQLQHYGNDAHPLFP